MHRLVGRVRVDPAVAQRPLEDLVDRPLVPRWQRAHVDARRLDDAGALAAGGDHVGVAVRGQDDRGDRADCSVAGASRVGSTSGLTGGVSASMASRCSPSRFAVTGPASTSQSAKASVPATWSMCRWLRSTVMRAASICSRIQRARSTDRWVSIDQRLVAVDDRVAGDPQHQRAVVEPVRLVVLAQVLAAVVEGEDAGRRPQEPPASLEPTPGPRRRSARPWPLP